MLSPNDVVISESRTSSSPPARRSRFRSASLLAIAAVGALSMSIACGGGQNEAKAPEGAAAKASGDGTSPGATGPAANDGPSTTTQLGQGGDLQGAKLESSSHKEVETKGDAGPSAGPGHSQEAGRRREDIQTIIMARRDDARACYDQGLKQHPGIEGDLDIKWVIDPEGNPKDVAVDPSKSQILDPGVGNCVVEIIKKIKFAPSAKGFETRTHYPFNFHPRNTPAKGPDAGR